MKDKIDIICDQIEEISARVRRTETLVHKIREKMRIPTNTPCTATSPTEVVVQGHDVTLSQIHHAMNQISATGPVKDEEITILKEGEVIAYIIFP
jgi:hypothetical protein